VACVSGGRAAARAAKKAGKLAGQQMIAFGLKCFN